MLQQLLLLGAVLRPFYPLPAVRAAAAAAAVCSVVGSARGDARRLHGGARTHQVREEDRSSVTAWPRGWRRNPDGVRRLGGAGGGSGAIMASPRIYAHQS